jgi:hypothetical protein
MHGSDVLAGRVLLGPARRSKEAEPEPTAPAAGPGSVPSGPGTTTDGAQPATLRPSTSGSAADRRTAAVAALLRAVADVLES